MVCQIAQNTRINVVLGEALRVLPQANCVEPVRNLLHGSPDSLIDGQPNFGLRRRNVILIACFSLRHSAAAGLRSLPKWCNSTGARYQAGHGTMRTTRLRYAPDFGSSERCAT